MPKTEVRAPTVLKYLDTEWDQVKNSSGSTPMAKLLREAAEKGARRKKIVRGQGGFFMNRSHMPPGFEVPEHSHSHDEFITILAGKITFTDGTELSADDTIVIHAHYRYGFVCGPEGAEFITVRGGEASHTISNNTATE